MLDWFSQAVAGYLAWWNAGGTVMFDQPQFMQYLEARLIVWAESKVK